MRVQRANARISFLHIGSTNFDPDREGLLVKRVSKDFPIFPQDYVAFLLEAEIIQAWPVDHASP